MRELILLASLACLLAACKGDDNAALPRSDEHPIGSLLRVSDERPAPNETVTLWSGEEFANRDGDGMLIAFANGLYTKPLAVDRSSLTIRIPEGARGPTLTVYDGPVTRRADLSVEYPSGAITALRVMPDMARAGSIVEVVTSNLKGVNPSQDRIEVVVAGASSIASLVGKNRLSARVPAIQAGDHRLFVARNGLKGASARLVVAR